MTSVRISSPSPAGNWLAWPRLRREAARAGAALALALLALLVLPPQAVSAPQRTLHELDVFVHGDLIVEGKDLAFHQNRIEENLAVSNRLLEGFQGPADSACCTRLVQANVATFSDPGPSDPNVTLNVIDTQADLDEIVARPPGVYLVQSVHICFGQPKDTSRRSCAEPPATPNGPPGEHLMISMDADAEGLLGELIAHERGINVGLANVATDSCSMMGNAAGGGCLTASECTKYASAGLSDPGGGSCSCLQDGVGQPPLPDGTACTTELPDGLCSGGLCASAHSAAGLSIYVSAGTDSDAGDPTTDRLLRMSAITGGWSEIGTLTIGGSAVTVPALAYSPSLDKLFGIAPQSGGNDRLVQIDRASGVASVIGTLDRRRVVGLTWNPISGRLIGSQIQPFFQDVFESIFVEIDPVSGGVTRVFGTGEYLITDGIQGLAFDPAVSILWGSSRVELFAISLASCPNGTCPMAPMISQDDYFAQTALDWVGGIREVKGLAPATSPRRSALESIKPELASNYSASIIDGFTPGGLAVVAPDADGDFAPDPIDTCPGLANPLQTDNDHDGIGNECDACPEDALNDADADTVCGDVDNCPAVANPLQTNDDSDALGNECDNCPKRANPAIARLAFQTTTGGQLDDDADGWGNTCDADFNQVGGSVDSRDFSLFKAAFGLKRSGSSCPDGGGTDADTLNDEPCDEYDLNGSGGMIDSLDFRLFHGLFGRTKKADGDDVEKCAACPLACEGDACGP